MRKIANVKKTRFYKRPEVKMMILQFPCLQKRFDRTARFYNLHLLVIVPLYSLNSLLTS